MIRLYPGGAPRNRLGGVYLGRATAEMAASHRILTVSGRPLHGLAIGGIGVGAVEAVFTNPLCPLALNTWRPSATLQLAFSSLKLVLVSPASRGQAR